MDFGGANFRIPQMIMEQIAPVVQNDPFAKARQQYDQQQLTPASSSIMMGNPFGGESQQMIAPEAPPTAAPPQSASIAGSLNSAPATDFMSSGIPKMLQKMGVDDKGLTVNALGRINLISRLKTKFGDYQQNPVALDAISKFDEVLNRVPQLSREQTNQVTNAGQRTLSAVLGGSGFMK